MADDHQAACRRRGKFVPLWLYSLLFPFPIGVLAPSKGCSRRHVKAWISALRIAQMLLAIEKLGWDGMAETHAWLREAAKEPDADPFTISPDAMREFASGSHGMQHDKFQCWRKAMLKQARAEANADAVAVLEMPAAGIRRVPTPDPSVIQIDRQVRLPELDRPLPPIGDLKRYQNEAQWLYFARNRICHWPKMLITSPAERRELPAVLIADILTDWIPAAGRGDCYCWGLEARYRHLRIDAYTFDDYVPDDRKDEDCPAATNHIHDVFALKDPMHGQPWLHQLRELRRVGAQAAVLRYLDCLKPSALATYGRTAAAISAGHEAASAAAALSV